MFNWTKLRNVILVCAAAVSLVACNDEPLQPVKHSVAEQPPEFSEFSIKAQLIESGKARDVAFGVSGSIADPDAPAETIADSVSFKPEAGDEPIRKLGEKVVYDDSDSANPRTQNRNLFLIEMAVEDCFNELDYGDMLMVSPYSFGPPVSVLNVANGAFVETNCDQSLAAQEVLLCAADKLLEVADTVAPVTWQNRGLGDPFEIRFPPQAEEDKFILRDAALSTLAHVAWYDQPNFDWARTDCVYGYTRMAFSPLRFEAPTEQSSWWRVAQLFCDPDNAVPCDPGDWGEVVAGGFQAENGEPLPPMLMNPNNHVAGVHAEARLIYKTNILRATLRLLKSIVEDSVRADRAGAAQQRSAAGDPALGLKKMWGVYYGASGPYNSLRHVLRVLYGRLETGRLAATEEATWSENLNFFDGAYYPNGPIAAGGVFPLTWPPGLGFSTDTADRYRPRPDLLDALEPGIAGRWESRPPRNDAEALASSLIAQAGIVIAQDTIDAHSDDNNWVSNTVRDILLANAAADRGLTVAQFTSQTTGEVFLDVFNELHPADLRYGLTQSLAAAKLLTGHALDDELELSDKLESGGIPHTVPTSEEGVVQITGGMPLDAFATDINPRFVGAMVAPQLPFIPEEHDGWYQEALPFQNVFMLGEQLKRTLKTIRATAELGYGHPGPEGIQELASAATAEANTWVQGNAKMFSPGYEFPDFEIEGVSREDIGEEVLLVYGQPVAAECAAGLRAHCPPPRFQYRATVTDAAQYAPDNEVDQYQDIANEPVSIGKKVTLDLVEPLTQQETNELIYSTWDGERYFFIVTVPGGDRPQGEVLAAFPAAAGTYMMAVSSLQRDLTNTAFGIGDAIERSQTCKQALSVSESAEYCVAGMQEDMFVPLANELNSDGGPTEDSWRHYLQRAKDAASEADALGRELIEIGMQDELRREAAQEELAQLCGNFADALRFKTQDGTLDLFGVDRDIEECLEEERYDVVFLSDNPIAKTPEEFQEVFCGNTNAARDLCGSSASFTVASLQLPSTHAVAPDDGSCLEQVQSFTLDPGENFNGLAFAAASESSWASQAGLRAALLRLKFHATADDAWWLELRGECIMASSASLCSNLAAAEVYPACLATDCEGTGALLASIFGNASRADIESALWNMGALAGEIPEGVFNIPVPAVNLAAGDPGVFSAATLYGSGQFEDVAGSYRLVFGDEVSSSDRALTRAVPMPPDFANARQSAGPDWYTRAFEYAAADPDAYVLIDATNAPIPFGTEFVAVSNGAVATHDAVHEWLADFGQHMHNRNDCGGTVVPGSSMLEGMKTLWATHDALPTPMKEGIFRNPTRRICALELGDFESTSFGDNSPSVFSDSMDDGPQLTCNNDDYPECVDYQASGLSLNALAQLDNRLLLKAKDWIPFETNSVGTSSWLYRGIEGEGESGDCPAPDFESADLISQECVYTDYGGDDAWMAARLTRPTVCGPDERVELFVSKNPLNDCASMRSLTLALGLSCYANSTRSVTGAPVDLPPSIESIDDITKLEGWIDAVRDGTGELLGTIFLRDVPKRVVDDFVAQRLRSLGEGQHGDLLQELGNDLDGIYRGWAQLGSALHLLSGDVKGARVQLEGIEISQRLSQLQIAKERLELNRQLAINAAKDAKAEADVVFRTAQIGSTADVFTTPMRLAAAMADEDFVDALNAIDETYIDQVKDGLAEQQELTTDSGENSVTGVLVDLDGDIRSAYDGIDASLTQIRTSTRQAIQRLNQIEQNESAAEYQAAQAAGADFASINGSTVHIPVNTVLRRQYDVTSRRYKRALETAKRAAYLARLAIEQRIGVRLDTLEEDIGPLPPPSSWLDNLCNATGVDYLALAGAPENDGFIPEPILEATEARTIAEATNQYIGDYVSQLEEFVEFYNVKYPFRQADDTALISMRDDLLQVRSECFVPSANLLYHSDALSKRGDFDASFRSLRGWSTRACDAETACAIVEPGVALENPDGQLKPPNDVGGVTWIRAIPYDEVPLAASAAGTVPSESPAPETAVYQTVSLNHGSHVLSWWDMARAADGGPVGSDALSPSVYTVSAHTADWKLVAYDTFVPQNSGTSGATWSERRTLAIGAAEGGDYHIVFTPVEVGDERASLAIANVQLEAVAAAGGGATAYQHTDDNRAILSGECDLQASDFRERFTRRCYGGPGEDRAEECFWELDDLVWISSEAIDFRESPLTGLVAAGNYNFRHVGLSVNVVGTGVLDCGDTPSASCYARGYLEYDLEHAAYNVPILDHAGDAHCFDFATGAIRSGKALAIERYLSLPLGSADAELTSQAAFKKPELAGRPISGAYKFRIKETEQLNWDRVDDVQLLLDYRYWSRVTTQRAD